PAFQEPVDAEAAEADAEGIEIRAGTGFHGDAALNLLRRAPLALRLLAV
ncbi:MAG: hypothetical protein ICV73_19230, partial [Acetobacteraceae bacterium]|nr:hypothetical protein [Acetobacteraceae bacterium]